MGTKLVVHFELVA